MVAMSGGVDSSAAAAMLYAEGLDVVGVTLRLYDATGTAASIGGRCCGPRDIEDARATAAALGVPHYVLDEVDAFSAGVIDDFVAEYRAGRTPNPCVRCNQRLKFGPLVRFARAVGATALATGHYARLVPGGRGGLPRVARAADRDKDQSYFLFAVAPDLLRLVRFPLGGMTKDAVRLFARRAGLPGADKPDSQQICFIPDGDHRGFVEAHGGSGRPGRIVDEDGAVLGRHAGTHAYTVGQRRGVPAPGGERRFVLRMVPSTGDVVVGPRARLGARSLRVSETFWPGGMPDGDRRCAVQIRHHAPALPAWVEPRPGRTAAVRLVEPAFGAAPGQAAVFYDGDVVVGGGFIAAAVPGIPLAAGAPADLTGAAGAVSGAW